MSKYRKFIIELSNKCPCKCHGCYNFFSESEICSNSIIKFILNLNKKYNISQVTLSGGEALYRKDFTLFMNKLNNHGITMKLDTTGIPLLNYNDDEIKNLCKCIDMIGIPVDGSNQDVSTLFRKNIFWFSTILK